MVAITKQAQRKQVVNRLKALQPHGQDQAGLKIAKKLKHWLEGVLSAKSEPLKIALYAGVKHEMRTSPIDAAVQAAGHVRCYPRVVGSDLRFYALPNLSIPDEMPKGNYGIPEPPQNYDEIPMETLDMVLMPAIAVTLQGHRLGQGGGFYDRLMSQCSGFERPIPFIALVMDEQIEPSIAVEAHDHFIHGILSPLLNLWTPYGASFYRHPINNLLAGHQ